MMPDWICAHCDDQDDYSNEFHWELKANWPNGQQTLVCDHCGTDRQYVVRTLLPDGSLVT